MAVFIEPPNNGLTFDPRLTGGTPQKGALAKIGDSIAATFRQNTRPIYNKLGRHVGSWGTVQELANGIIYRFPGEETGPPQEWTTKSYGITTPVTAFLLRQGIRPKWVPDAEAVQQQEKLDGGIDLPDFDFPEIKLPSLSPPKLLDENGNIGLGSALVITGGAIALALILRR